MGGQKHSWPCNTLATIAQPMQGMEKLNWVNTHKEGPNDAPDSLQSELSSERILVAEKPFQFQCPSHVKVTLECIRKKSWTTAVFSASEADEDTRMPSLKGNLSRYTSNRLYNPAINFKPTRRVKAFRPPYTSLYYFPTFLLFTSPTLLVETMPSNLNAMFGVNALTIGIY